MATRTWERLKERFGGEEGARQYAREMRAKRRAAGKIQTTAADKAADRRRDKRRKSGDAHKARLVLLARIRARKRGLEATIQWRDILWPEMCPVLGVRLVYGMGRGEEDAPFRASLDRHDNSRGYVPGNVYVISYRANQLKSNANIAEIEAVLDYMRNGPTAF